jgi:hypothetical protein
MKELLLKTLDFLGFAYWVEITTDFPKCTYYFGPFLNEGEARDSQGGYLEDLQQEGAQGIAVFVKRCKPNDLTIFDDVEVSLPFMTIPKLRGEILG